MLHTFEDWFCSAKLLDFPFFCYCTFLYRLISVVSYFYLYFSYLRKRKTLPYAQAILNKSRESSAFSVSHNDLTLSFCPKRA